MNNEQENTNTKTESKTPLVCVIMICHNDIQHIKRSIGEYLLQATDETSILFVDDSSEDGSGDFARQLIADRGEVIRTPFRMNVGGARNFGIEHLKRKPESERPTYVWFHDSDDYIYTEAIRRVLESLKGKSRGVDCLSIPIGIKRANGTDGKTHIDFSPVAQNELYDAPCGPVGSWSIVFRLEKYVEQAANQMCEHVAWHYLQFDQFDTWGKVDSKSPCYVWDRTNTLAISQTVDFCHANSNTIEGLAFSDLLVKSGLKDSWVSDNLRNIANMYDVRHKLTKPWVRKAWAERFRMECSNMMGGHHVH